MFSKRLVRTKGSREHDASYLTTSATVYKALKPTAFLFNRFGFVAFFSPPPPPPVENRYIYFAAPCNDQYIDLRIEVELISFFFSP